MSKNNIDYQIVTNHLGSPVAVVDSSTGVVEQEIVYDVDSNSNDVSGTFKFLWR